MKTRQIVKDLWNVEYPDSVDFEEMVKFQKHASSSQIQAMRNACKDEDWDTFKQAMKEVAEVCPK
jgi:hypothetical protein